MNWKALRSATVLVVLVAVATVAFGGCFKTLGHTRPSATVYSGPAVVHGGANTAAAVGLVKAVAPYSKATPAKFNRSANGLIGLGILADILSR